MKIYPKPQKRIIPSDATPNCTLHGRPFYTYNHTMNLCYWFRIESNENEEMRMIATRPASFFVNFARFPMNHYSRLPLLNFCNVSGFSSRCSSKCCILKHIFPLQEEPQQHTQTFVSVRENLLVLTSCDKRTRNPTQAATSTPITWIDSVGWIGSLLDAGWGTGLTFKIVGIGDGPDLDITWI